MLVLSRKQNETIQIGDDVKVTIVRTGGNSVQIGIDAPDDCRIVRGEIIEQTRRSKSEDESRPSSKRAKYSLRCLGSIS